MDWIKKIVVGLFGGGMALGCLLIIPLIWSLQFGVGYLVGLGVEWFAGKTVVLGPLRLPIWLGIAFIIVGNISKAAYYNDDTYQ